MRRREFDTGNVSWPAVLVAIFGVVVVVVLGILWRDFDQGEVDEGSPSSLRPSVSSTPASTSAIAATDGRVQPEVLLVGDGYAAGAGASDPGLSYASLLGSDLGWDVTVAASVGAGYTRAGVDGRTVPELYAEAQPTTLKPDAVIVQSGYGGDFPDADVADAIDALARQIRTDLPDVPLIVIGSLWPGPPTELSARRDQTIADAWQAQEDMLFLRPQEEGWARMTIVRGGPDDAGHAQIATNVEAALQGAGLTP